MSRLLLEPDTSLPLTAVSLALPRGSELDPPGKEGLTRMTLRLMRRTPEGRDADATNELLDSLGATLTGDVSRTTSGLNGVVLSENLGALTGLMKGVWTEPGLAAKEFELLKAECLAEWRESLDNDRTLAFRALDRRLFEGHALSRPAAGTFDSLSQIERNDVVEHAARLIRAEQPWYAASGDFEREQLTSFCDELNIALGPLGHAPTLPETNEPTPPPGRRLFFIDKPERSQSQIALGGLGSHPADPDHLALVVGNTIFGGTFTARLSQEVRVKRGWSYGAYSYLSLERQRGTFTLWTFPEASDTADCLELVLQLLETWVERGVSEAELKRAKTYLKRSYVFSIDTASKRLQQELDVRLHGWPTDYYTSYLDKVAALTRDEVNAAIRARIDPSRLAICVVGTAASLFPALEARLSGLSHAEIQPFDRTS